MEVLIQFAAFFFTNYTIILPPVSKPIWAKTIRTSHTHDPLVYSLSIFRWFYGVSPLLVKIQGCGFHDTVLLVRKTIIAVNRTF